MEEIRKYLKTSCPSTLLEGIHVEINDMLTFESEKSWLQLIKDTKDTYMLNFFYPKEAPPNKFLKGEGVFLSESCRVEEWKPQSFCTIKMQEVSENDFPISKLVFDVFIELFKSNCFWLVSIEKNEEQYSKVFLKSAEKLYHIGLSPKADLNNQGVKNIALAYDSEVYKKVYSYHTNLNDLRIALSEGKEDYSSYYSKRIELLNKYFYEVINLIQRYSLEDVVTSGWSYYPVRCHLDSWRVEDFNKMVSSIRQLGDRSAYDYLEVILNNLQKVIGLVHREPGLSRTLIYKETGLNPNVYGQHISSCLIRNNILREKKVGSKRLLYPF
ncbi:MAG: hypothetical protein AWU56_328 [Idiomarina sp. T82-3]|uniref:hypothetical protein n=1 Tax=Idiomarina TaxID=135575 RepID=UPI000794E895|nr:hypothetical protein [Idiomarina sp. T82-3]KXS36213.1 MAG: hypothetical protein AWU56_328 [Idiomarina sp. T82-3]